MLCSDGVCDVAEADDCAAVVASAWERGEDAAAVLTNWAMQVNILTFRPPRMHARARLR